MRYRRLTATVGAVGTVLIAATSVQAADEHSGHGHVASAYTLELLPTPAGDVTAMSALGLNDDADIVGIVRPTSGAQPQQTVYWWRHGDHFHTYALDNLPGSAFSRAFDITTGDQIVGEAFDSTGASVPIRWTGSGSPTHVTSLNPDGTGLLTDINNAGIAVGSASGNAVQVNADGTVTTLPAPPEHVPGTAISAASVSENGTVAGRTTIAIPHGDHFHNELRGVVWRNGVPVVLDVPAGGSSPLVTEATDGGAIYGAATIGGRETAMMWEEDGTPVVLDTPTVGTYTHARANAATEDEVIVGSVSQMAGNTSFGAAAVAWDAHGPVDLASRVATLPEGVTLQTASDINSSGQIVGTAVTPQGPRGFLLTPEGHHEDPSEPDAPHQPTLALEGTDGLRVTWEAPHHDGGAPVLGYRVTLTSATGIVVTQDVDGADVRSTVFAGLAPGTYSATVAARNGVGRSTNSTASTSVTITAPTQPDGGAPRPAPDPVPNPMPSPDPRPDSPATPPTVPTSPAAPVTPAPAAPVKSTIIARPVVQTPGRAARLNISIAPSATGSVTVRVGKRRITKRLDEGRAIVMIPANALRPGRRVAIVEYAGVRGKFTRARKIVRVNVRKAVPKLRVRVVSTAVRAGDLAIVRVSATAPGVRPGGRVVVRISKTTRVVPLKSRGTTVVRVPLRASEKPRRLRAVVVALGTAEMGRRTVKPLMRITR